MAVLCKISEFLHIPVKYVNSNTTAKVSVFALHTPNKQFKLSKGKSWYIIFMVQWYIKGDNYFYEKLPWIFLHCFHEHEHKCSRSTLTFSMHNFPIASLFEKVLGSPLYFFVFKYLNGTHNKVYITQKNRKKILSKNSGLSPRQRFL